MWDWYMGSGYSFYGNPYRYYLLGDYLGLERVYPGQVDSKGKPVRTVIRKEELRQRKLSPRKLPREFRSIYKKFVASLNSLDKRVLESLPRMREHMIIVKKGDLNASSIRDKAVDFRKLTAGNEKEFLSQGSTKNYYRMAAQAFRENRNKGKLSDQTIRKILNQPFRMRTLPYEPVSGVKRKAVAGRTLAQQKIVLPEKGAIIEGRYRRERNRSLIPIYPRSKFSMRFRDWNPDVKVASRVGVTIRYSSRTNEVRCPELNISSRSVRGSWNRRSLTSFSSSGRSYSSGSGGSSYSGSSSSSSSSSSRSSSSRSSGRSSGRSSSSRTKKK